MKPNVAGGVNRQRRRRWRQILIGFGLLLLFAVIGSRMTPESEIATSPGVTRNRTHEQLQAASEEERGRVLRSALGSSEPCGEITRSFFQGLEASTGSAYWNIECNNGRSYVVRFHDDAQGVSSDVMDCELLQAITRVGCFQAFARP